MASGAPGSFTRNWLWKPPVSTGAPRLFPLQEPKILFGFLRGRVF